MRQSITTEKIARRGVRVPSEYGPDMLDMVRVGDVASPDVVTLYAGQTAGEVRRWLGSGVAGAQFPVLDAEATLAGVLTRRELAASSIDDDTPIHALISRPPCAVYRDCTVRQAIGHMLNHDLGRLPVIERADRRLVGIITRSDVLSAYARCLPERLSAARPSSRRQGLSLEAQSAI